MDFTRLRLSGFKSFVDPTELIIKSGLTGVVGPNGCGKSNLLEALRWVMGENSAKSMRGSEMDDVIFAGTSARPARNLAEVTLSIVNEDHSAPAIFNDQGHLEISRRIERQSGSAYQVNNRDVRHRDIQLLFADASTGAHSPSLVSQGRISHLINAKPQQRRQILEEAAGISGLHSRRKEAEGKLRAAEHNLERLADIELQLQDQIRGLHKQARQANRYKKVSGEIRRLQALIDFIDWRMINAQNLMSKQEITLALKQVATLTMALGELNREQAIAAAKLPDFRQKEAEFSASLRHVTVTRDSLDGEESRVAATQVKLKELLLQIDQDVKRERDVITDSVSILHRLQREKTELTDQTKTYVDSADELAAILKIRQTATLDAEWTLEGLTQRQARQHADRDNLRHNREEYGRRLEKLVEQRATIEDRLAQLESNNLFTIALSNAENTFAAAENNINIMSVRSGKTEDSQHLFQQKEQNARDILQTFQSKEARIEAEKEGLEKLCAVMPVNGKDHVPIMDQLSVCPGYEIALGAALDADLEAPDNAVAQIHWHFLQAYSQNQPLPGAVKSMVDYVSGADLLNRRLSQIGIVEDEGHALSLLDKLKPGQRLVSLRGGVWRWDGLCISPEVQGGMAVRLSQKNHLKDLAQQLARIKNQVGKARGTVHQAREQLEVARAEARQSRLVWREAEEKAARARRSLTEAEKQATRHQSEEAALKDRLGHLIEEYDRLRRQLEEIDLRLSGLPPGENLGAEIHLARQHVDDNRKDLSEARVTHDSLILQSGVRKQRFDQIDREQSAWTLRTENVELHIADLVARRHKTTVERDGLESRPGEIIGERRKLNHLIAQAEQGRKQAAKILLDCEDIMAGRDRDIRGGQVSLTEAREQKVRLETNQQQYQTQEAHLKRRIREEFECEPQGLRQLAKIDDPQELPDPEQTRHGLERLKAERERLGAVNLRAEVELTDIQAHLDRSISEREELEGAIKALRRAITNLNREGRSRILQAFDQVNEHFKHLFITLFGGGEAYLELTESEDPLAAGLEIMASPPGKKMQNLGLLSGGEQALTALSLIFAVFKTNPSPICVLDEVDAPLDDANVDRFCDLLDEMAEHTSTRFLIVTHNAVTMSRMSRLFGVTMAERGVSQLVSVDLESAEKMRDRAEVGPC